jgi:hypothetical protein
MEKVFKGFIGFICGVMTLAWLRIMVAPMGFAERMAMNPDVPFGLSNMRSFVGTYVLCLAVFSFFTLKTGDRKWLLVLLCLFVGSAIGRTCGLVLDGFHQQIVGGIVLEILLIAITLAAYRKLPSK